MSRKLIHPINLGLDMVFHDTHVVFLSPLLHPHQNFLRSLFICSQRPRGSLKHDMEYVGIACATDLIKTSLPPKNKHFCIQHWTCFQILSFKYLEHPSFALPTSVGRPKYLSVNASTIICRTCLTATLLSDGVLGEKKTALLSRFTACPEQDA